MVIRATGMLVAETILRVLADYYPTLGSRFVLWDLTGADVSTLRREDFIHIAQVARDTLPRAAERKTAYAVADKSSFMKMWQYLNEAVFARIHAEYQVFTSVADAKDWLES